MIETLSDFFTAVERIDTELPYHPTWWRGQAQADWPLVASVHRVTDRGPYERGVTLRFQARAPARNPNTPPLADDSAWLNLMQHYGLPTRLLDWTESPLFALYFAVSEKDYESTDASLWALDPGRMNEIHLSQKGTLRATDDEARQLFRIFRKGNDAIPEGQDVAALTPVQQDIRNMVQLSVFTIHATPRPLEQYKRQDAFLRKMVIRGSAKRPLRRGLRKLGISGAYLFPDLTHLAAEEKANCFCLQTPCPHAEDK